MASSVGSGPQVFGPGVAGGGSLDITDPIAALRHLFLGGREPPPPYPECGLDPTPDDLGCRDSPCP